MTYFVRTCRLVNPPFRSTSFIRLQFDISRDNRPGKPARGCRSETLVQCARFKASSLSNSRSAVKSPISLQSERSNDVRRPQLASGVRSLIRRHPDKFKEVRRTSSFKGLMSSIRQHRARLSVLSRVSPARELMLFSHTKFVRSRETKWLKFSIE